MASALCCNGGKHENTVEPDPDPLHLHPGPFRLTFSHWLAVGSPVSPPLDFLPSDIQLMSPVVQDHVEKGREDRLGLPGKGGGGVKADLISNAFSVSTPPSQNYILASWSHFTDQTRI